MAGRKVIELAQSRLEATDRAAIETALQAPRRLAMIISPPRIRTINRFGGFAAGDRALIAFAHRIRAAAPQNAVVARFAGAKFALVVGAPDEDEAIEITGRMFDDLASSAEELGAPHIGAAWSAQAVGHEAMVSAALTALDAARDEGAQGLELAVVDPEAEADAVSTAREALAAIRAGSVNLALQPIVDAETPGRILFREALIRLQRPSGEIVSAGRFMPTLMRLGAAAEADIAMLHLTLQALERDPGQRISLNVSADSLSRPGWRAAFLDAADRAPEAVERMIVEISEEAAACDVVAAAELFAILRAHGAALALDDFGAGRTSFSHLRDFRFDMLKIDGGFIRGIDAHTDNQVLVAALSAIAKSFDMLVIAEFVETAQEARTLRGLGVDGFQGFLFGSPTLVWSEGERIDRVIG